MSIAPPNKKAAFCFGTRDDLGRLYESKATNALDYLEEQIMSAVGLEISREEYHALPELPKTRRQDAKKADWWVPGRYGELHRNKSTIVDVHSLALDIDVHEDAENALANLAKLPYAYLAYESASSTKESRRVRVAIPLAIPIKTSLYKKAVARVCEVLGVTPNTESTTPSRLFYRPTCFRGETRTGIFSDLALPLFAEDLGGSSGETETSNSSADRNFQIRVANQPKGIPIEDLEQALSVIDSSCSRDEWLKVCQGLSHESQGGEQGFQMFHQWSKGGENFAGEDDCRTVWKSVKNNTSTPVTAASILSLAKKSKAVEVLNEKPPQGPRPLPKETLVSAPSVEMDMLPENLRAFAEDVTERGNFCLDYVAVSLVTALGSTIGRQCAVYPKLKDDWHEYPNIWSLCVGRPGMMKSPAMNAAMGPLKQLERTAQQEFSSSHKEFQLKFEEAKIRIAGEKLEARKSVKDGKDFELKQIEPEEPTVRRFTTSDVSTAALTVLLQQNPNGLLIESDEVISVMRAFERDPELRSFLLTGWNGKQSHRSDRIGRGLNNYIEAVCLSWIGGTQPGKIIPLVKGALEGGNDDDGLLQRFQLVAFPDGYADVWKHVDREPNQEALAQASQVFRSIENILPSYGAANLGKCVQGVEHAPQNGVNGLRFNVAANGLFLEWWQAMEDRVRAGGETDAMESVLQKQRKLVPAIALICQLASDPHSNEVEARHVETALKWAIWSEAHQRRLFSAAATNDVAIARLILKKFGEGRLAGQVPARDIYRPQWKGLTRAADVQEGLDLLTSKGWLAAVDFPTGGRQAHLYQLTAEASKTGLLKV